MKSAISRLELRAGGPDDYYRGKEVRLKWAKVAVIYSTSPGINGGP
jgi:hypothetical protein